MTTRALLVCLKRWTHPRVVLLATNQNTLQSWHDFSLAWCMFLILVLPTLSGLHGYPVLVADRYSYLASIVVVPPFARAIHHALRRTEEEDGVTSSSSSSSNSSTLRHRRRRAGGGIRGIMLTLTLALLVAALTLQTNLAAYRWSTPEMLWSHATAADPTNAIAFSNLRAVLEEKGTTHLSTKLIRAAWRVGHSVIHMNPNYTPDNRTLAQAWSKTASQLSQHGLVTEAVESYAHVYSLNHSDARIYVQAANSLAALHALAHASNAYARAILLLPTNAAAHFNYAELLFLLSASSDDNKTQAFKQAADMFQKSADLFAAQLGDAHERTRHARRRHADTVRTSATLHAL